MDFIHDAHAGFDAVEADRHLDLSVLHLADQLLLRLLKVAERASRHAWRDGRDQFAGVVQGNNVHFLNPKTMRFAQ